MLLRPIASPRLFKSPFVRAPCSCIAGSAVQLSLQICSVGDWVLGYPRRHTRHISVENEGLDGTKEGEADCFRSLGQACLVEELRIECQVLLDAIVSPWDLGIDGTTEEHAAVVKSRASL